MERGKSQSMLLVEVYGLYLSWAELQDRQKCVDEAAAPSYHIPWNKKMCGFHIHRPMESGLGF